MTTGRGIAARLAAVFWLVCAGALAHAQTADRDPMSWSGDWQTFWRNGLATMTLRQDGATVTGSFSPGEGRVEAQADGALLRGTWRSTGGAGDFVFALSDDGETFTGRFGNGEYWNGARSGARAAFPGLPIRRGTPRELFTSLLLRANAATFEGNAAALREAARLLTYAEDPASEDGGSDSARRQYLWDIMNLSTFRATDVPEAPDAEGGDTAVFTISPLGSDETFDVVFRQGIFGWSLEVPPLGVLEDTRARFLDSLGATSMANFQTLNASSPRETLFTFLSATEDWRDGGRERALAVMDLSRIPERLRSVEGDLLADYLWAVINRVGFILRQEVPNLADQQEPYVFYAHPVGNVVIEPQFDPGSETVTWRFSSDTMAQVPGLYLAMQSLPVAQGLEGRRPLSDFFVLREAIRDTAPTLLTRRAGLELWQWAAIGLTVILAGVAGHLARRIVPWVVARALRLQAGQGGPGAGGLARPAGAFVFLLILLLTYTRLGLAQSGSGMIGRLVAVAVVIAAAAVVFRLVGLVGFALRRAAKTQRSGLDEIVTSLLIGLVKLIVVVIAIILAADVVGLPYEGVLTGLGVGGVALAFAARDTVSNLLSGAILLADRPFKRDDLVVVDGTFAIIDEVGLRSTKLRTLDDAVLVLPNSHLSDKAIENWGKRRRRRTIITMGLTYDTTADKLDAFCKQAANVYRAQVWTDDSEVYVGVDRFADSAIEVKMIGFYLVTAFDRQVEAQHNLILDLVRLAERLGVSFAFPTRMVHMAPPPPGASPVLSGPDAPDAPGAAPAAD